MIELHGDLFTIRINICSGIIVSYLVHNYHQDLKALFEITFEGQIISLLSIGENEAWIQRSGQFLESEVVQVGAAIEEHYSHAFATD